MSTKRTLTMIQNDDDDDEDNDCEGNSSFGQVRFQIRIEFNENEMKCVVV